MLWPNYLVTGCSIYLRNMHPRSNWHLFFCQEKKYILSWSDSKIKQLTAQLNCTLLTKTTAPTKAQKHSLRLIQLWNLATRCNRIPCKILKMISSDVPVVPDMITTCCYVPESCMPLLLPVRRFFCFFLITAIFISLLFHLICSVI